MTSHHYSNKEVSALHDASVLRLGGIIADKGVDIRYPDQIDNSKKQPDIAVGDVVVIELKVLNPTQRDWEVDQESIRQKEESNSWSGGGQFNSKPIQAAVDQAARQLRESNTLYKIVALKNPLQLQKPAYLVKSMLGGMTQITLSYDESVRAHSIAGSKKIRVPIKRDTCIDGILYIPADDTCSMEFWTVGEKEVPSEITALGIKISTLWG